MKYAFRVYVGSPEKSIWTDFYSVFEDKEEAVNAFLSLVERNDWLGKKVFAKLTLNSTVACLHRFDVRAGHANNFSGQSDYLRAQLEMVIAHHKELRGV